MRTTSDKSKKLLKNGAIALVALVALVAAGVAGASLWLGDGQAQNAAAEGEAPAGDDGRDTPEEGDGDESADIAETPEEALQQDLNLSPEQAEDAFDQQAEAERLRQQLQADLGDSYGGASYDIANNELTVNVTDEGAAETVEAAGATPQVVNNGVNTLQAAADSVTVEGATDVYVNQVNDQLVVEVVEGTDVDAAAVADDAGLEADDVSVEEVAEGPQLHTPEPNEGDVVGGLAYGVDPNADGVPDTRCSIGFPVTDSGGNSGFATAGHCGESGNAVLPGNMDVETWEGTGTFEGSDFPGTDMAWVSTPDHATSNLVYRYDRGGYADVTGSEQAPVGGAVCRSGATTGWHCGAVQSYDNIVYYPDNQTVTGLVRSTACSEGGDSGGSWVSGDQAQGVHSGGSGNCNNGGITYYQPLNPLLEAYGLDLVTSYDPGASTQSEDAEETGDAEETEGTDEEAEDSESLDSTNSTN